MHMLIALAIGPVGRWVTGFLFVCAVVMAIYAKGRIDGREAALAKVEHANAKARDAADAAQRDVLTCPGRWNREAGRCER